MQLKKISDELTERIKHKKFVPKKKAAESDDDEPEEKAQANGTDPSIQLVSGVNWRTATGRSKCTKGPSRPSKAATRSTRLVSS